MIESQTAPAAAKKPRRQVAKSTARPAEPKVKTAIVISADSMKRLGIQAVMTGKTQSELIEELIQANMRRFVVQDRFRDSSAQVDSADWATQEVSSAA